MKNPTPRHVAIGFALASLAAVAGGCGTSGGMSSGGGAASWHGGTYASGGVATSEATSASVSRPVVAPYGAPRTSASASASGGSAGSGYAAQGGGDSSPASGTATAPSAMGGGGSVASGTAPGGYRGAERPPEMRSGLATEYGESRTSYMSYTSFTRATPDTPFANASVHYNDARGSAIQAVMHGGAPAVYFVDAYHGGIHISLRDENGQALPGYHMGDRVYMVGEAGRRYSVMLENTTPLRVEAVLSVDGLDVISGQPAALSRRGYLLAPYSHLNVEGFRQNNATVAAFRFGSVSDSYAAQTTGSARNVGVVGVALFHETGAILTPADDVDEYHAREQANPFPGSNGSFAPPPPRRNYW